jgi:hypothetical protein
MLTIKGYKISWVWYLCFAVVMVISIFEPHSNANQGFIGIASAGAGLLAKGIGKLFGGGIKAARKAKREARSAQKEAEKLAKASEITANTAEIKKAVLQQQAELTGGASGGWDEPNKGGVMGLVKKYWWIGAAVLGLVFILPMLKKKTVGNHRRSASRRPVKRSASRKPSKSNFAARMAKARAAKRRKPTRRRK